MGVGCYIGIELRDECNDIVRYREERAHSFTRNFARGIAASFRRVIDNSAYVDSSGTTRPASVQMGIYRPQWEAKRSAWGAGFYMYPAGAGSRKGVVVGSSDTAFGIEQVDLQSPILHGNDEGQLYHGEHLPPTVVDAVDGTSSELVFAREFANNTAADVTIREIGLMGSPAYETGYTSGNTYSRMAAVLLTRDVLETPIVLPPNQVVEVKHIMRVNL